LNENELPDRWWQDKPLYLDMLSLHGSPAQMSQATGVAANTLSKWRARHGLPKLPPGTRANTVPVETTDPEESSVLEALRELGDTATVEQLADRADISPRRVREALERAGHDGYRIVAEEGAVRLSRVPTETGERHAMSADLFDGDLFRFGVVSDTHLGSSAERPESVEAVYDVFAREEIRAVYHCGDLVDGLGIYRNHNTEVKLHTYEAQVDHATELYPVRDGIETFLIGGNHDLEGDFGRAGADPVQAVCNRRSDMTYLGRYSAWVDLPNGATMQLLHPQGGASYATSYRPQKIAESYEAGSKPNILGIGHWHRTGYFMVRGIQTFLAGTHQGPTTFSTRKGMGEAGWGSWLIECRLADDGSVVRFKPEWLPVYPGRA
jgi:predicted phosphodiesterase